MILRLRIHRLLLVYSQHVRVLKTVLAMNPTMLFRVPHRKKLPLVRLSTLHRHVLEHSHIRLRPVPRRVAVAPADRGHIHGSPPQNRLPTLHNSICSWKQRPAFRMRQILGLLTDQIDCKARSSHAVPVEALSKSHRSTYLRQSPIEPAKPQAGRASNHRSHLRGQCLRPHRPHSLKRGSDHIIQISHHI